MLVVHLIILMVISVVMFKIAQNIFKKTKVAPPILYLLIGVLFGVGGLALLSDKLYIFGNPKYFPNLGLYSTTMIWLLFFSAGFNLDLTSFKSKGGATLKLSTLPIFTEILIMLPLTYLMINRFPGLNMELTLTGVGIIVILFAMASPANIIPITIGHMQSGRSGNGDIASSMIAASVFDNFTPLPFVIVCLSLLINPSANIFGTVVTTLVFIIVMTAISALLGFLMALAFKPLLRGVKEQNRSAMLVAFLMFIVIFLIIKSLFYLPIIGSQMNIFAILVAVLTSTFIRLFDSTGAVAGVALNLSKLFGLLGMPIIFIGTGATVDLSVISNFWIIIFVLIFITSSITLKSLGTAKFALRESVFKEKDKKYAMAAFIPKGVTLVNFSIVVTNIPGTEDLVRAMVLIAAPAIIITIPLGVTLMTNRGRVWLETTKAS